MTDLPQRKFTIADGMILVAATAAGLALAREVLQSSRGLSDPWWLSLPMGGGSPLAAGWSIGLFLCRLKKPRPRMRRLVRQPGAGANLVALVVFALWTGFALIKAALNQADIMDLFAYSGIGAGAAVLGAWLVLFLTRTGKFEKSWIDRSGIAVGICWILLMLVVLAEVFLN